MERRIVYFEQPGPKNTEETARLAGTGIKLIVVPHQYGFTQEQRFPPELVTELAEQGHAVHFGTMLFHTDRFYGSGSAEAMAMILRTICQGMKVCVEIVLMAADGGHVRRGEEVIAVSGTAGGADTAVVAIAATSANLHELHITEIICKPLQTRSWQRGTSPYDERGKDTRQALDRL